MSVSCYAYQFCAREYKLKESFQVKIIDLKMEIVKKKRAVNWSPEEKEILRQLIAQSAQILEDKSTKTSINIMKNREWGNVLLKFNELTGSNRSINEVKLAWKRMKLVAKSNLSSHRREQSQTGGGTKPPSPSPEDLAVMAIAPHDFVIEVNDFDSDAVIPTPTLKDQSIADPIHIIETTEEQALPSHKGKKSRTTAAKRKRSAVNNRTEEIRESILKSNIDFKKRHLEILEEEHKYNKEIALLKIKKLKLEIDQLIYNKYKTTETENSSE